jgi:hypothetical protein
MSPRPKSMPKRCASFGHAEWDHAKQQLDQAGYHVIESRIEPAPNDGSGSAFWTVTAVPPSWWPRKNDCCGTGTTKLEAGKDLFEKRLKADVKLRGVVQASPQPGFALQLARPTNREVEHKPQYLRNPWTGTPCS